MSLPYTDKIKALDAVTTNTNWDNISMTWDNSSEWDSSGMSYFYDFSKRQQITATLTASDISTGNGVFTFDVCNGNPIDPSQWITGIAVKNSVTANTTTLVTSITLNTNTSVSVVIPAGFKYYRVNVAITTDGTYTAVFEGAG